MKNILIKLGEIDRRYIFILIALSVLIPLVKSDWIKMPIKTTQNTQIVFDELSKLKAGDKILVSFEYGASTKPEIHPMAIALLNQMFSKGIKVYIISLWPEGVIMAKDVVTNVINSEVFELVDGVDYVMFDYKVGGEIVIKNIASDFRGVYMQDINKKSISQIPMMKDIYSVEDFDFVFDLSAGVPGNAEWVQYACDPKNVPLSSGCTSIMVTDAIPYVESGQLKGILAGMPGAAEYENLVNNFMKNDLENENIVNFENILSGKATSRMSAQSLAHIVMVLFIIIGNVSYFLSRKKGNRF
ncbi:MAG: hypothetical protein CMG49_01770 [Candidatus Marinimicrobia bacterium]|nr:hypothetical protein [Candidatus Neomarinimicrobiota bacterium]